MDRATFILAHDTARRRAVECVAAAPTGFVVEVKPRTRTLEQNALMWARLGEISRQVVWYGQKLTDEEWKDVMSASLKKQKAVPGIDGGFVILGQRTSKMTVAEMSELMTLIEAFAAQHGVEFEEVAA